VRLRLRGLKQEKELSESTKRNEESKVARGNNRSIMIMFCVEVAFSLRWPAPVGGSELEGAATSRNRPSEEYSRLVLPAHTDRQSPAVRSHCKAGIVPAALTCNSTQQFRLVHTN
jgi:hypothetical protein